MDTIQVDKRQLIETLTTNRAKHIEAHKKAHKKWLKQVQKVLTQRLADAKTGKVNLSFRLPEPTSYEKSYDTALEKLSWHLQDEIELSGTEFAQYVQDEWGWKGEFVGTSSLYQ